MRGLPPSTLILLYDGTCGVCGAAVRFVLQRDRARRFRFAALDSAVGRALRQQTGLPAQVDSLVVIHAGGAAIRSTAVLLIARALGWPWRLAAVGRLLPRSWRDALYDGVAARRAAWSQRHALACLIPTPEQQQQFLTSLTDVSVVPEQTVVSHEGIASPLPGDVP